MKKMLLLFSLCTLSGLLYATPASTATTQQLLDVIQVDQSIQKVTDDTFQSLTEQIMQYHHIPATQENQKRVYNVVKKYYSSDHYKQEFRQKLFNIYSRNLTEEEMQEWITFYKTPIGKSILDHQAFEDKIVNAVEQIFPEDLEPSPQAQEKLSQAMQRFFQR